MGLVVPTGAGPVRIDEGEATPPVLYIVLLSNKKDAVVLRGTVCTEVLFLSNAGRIKKRLWPSYIFRHASSSSHLHNLFDVSLFANHQAKLVPLAPVERTSSQSSGKKLVRRIVCLD